MVKDHSDSERGNPLPPHGLLFPIRTIQMARKETRCHHICYSFRLQQGLFYMHHSTDRIAYTTAFVTPVVEHWMEREIAEWVHPMKDRSDDPSHHESLYMTVSKWSCCSRLQRLSRSMSIIESTIQIHPQELLYVCYSVNRFTHKNSYNTNICC